MKNDFQPIKSDMKQERDKLCYLTIGDKDEKWGVVVTTIGYQFIPPGTKYPLSAHPDNYSFMPRGGRILNEYQLVYITKGSGYFASQSCPEAPVKAGTVISLFPGEWHSYHPDDETGWDEYWVGFKGAYIDDRVANRFLVREQPLHNIGISSGIVSLYEEILQLASVEKAGCQQMMSSIVLHILGSIYYKERNNSYANTFILEKVNAARELMKDVDNPRDVEAIARELGEIRLGNTVMLGAICDYLPFPAEVLEQCILKRFARKKPELIELNRQAFAAGRAASAQAATTESA